MMMRLSSAPNDKHKKAAEKKISHKENSDMIKTVTKTKTTGLFITTAVLALLSLGCSQDNADQQATEAENMDLTQITDLYEEPIQPNPLALAPEDVVVTVEGTDITQGEIMQAVQMTMMQLSRQVPPQQLSQMYGQIYQNMIDTLVANVLLEEAAKNSSLAVSDEELAEEIDTIKANAPEGSSLEETLAENDIDLNEWKEDLRAQLLTAKLVEEKTANVAEPTLTEIKSFYEENIDSFRVPENVTASHILIAFDENETDETKATKKADIEAIRQQLLSGVPFEDLASERSDCPSSARGGNLGTFGRGQMVPEFEEAAFNMDVGSISDVVETQFGYHIIKLTDHQEAGMSPLAEVTEQLKMYLTNQKKQEALVAYIDELREKADVVMHKPNLDAGDTE